MQNKTDILIFCYDETSRALLLKQRVNMSDTETQAFNVSLGMILQCKLYIMTILISTF